MYVHVISSYMYTILTYLCLTNQCLYVCICACVLPFCSCFLFVLQCVFMFACVCRFVHFMCVVLPSIVVRCPKVLENLKKNIYLYL